MGLISAEEALEFGLIDKIVERRAGTTKPAVGN